MSKKRAAFYIDGFNIYHALDDLRRPHLKWLSLAALAERLIPKRDEEIVSVVYFTAYLTHKPDKLVRHRAYVAALEATGVECIIGRFKYKNMLCRSCRATWRAPEEKETDVNIAVRLVRDAFKDIFDVCYLISADTDLAPAIRTMRSEFPTKEFVSVATPHRPHSSEFLKLANRTMKITDASLEHCQLPDSLKGKDGALITRPANYARPKPNA